MMNGRMSVVFAWMEHASFLFSCVPNLHPESKRHLFIFPSLASELPAKVMEEHSILALVIFQATLYYKIYNCVIEYV